MRTSRARRVAAVAVALATASGLAVYTGTTYAGAAPQPSIQQLQTEVNSLQARVDKIGQQYDAVGAELTAAQAKLASVSKQETRAQQQYTAARAQLAAIAVTQYENQNGSSFLGLLTSNDPSAVLNQESLLLEMAGTHNLEVAQFLTTAQELDSVRQQRQRTEAGIAALHNSMATQKATLDSLMTKAQGDLQNLIAQAAAAQQQPTSVGSGGTGTPTPYPGPTGTQADTAVKFAYDQLGKPYVWGATGPNSYDCSGLVQAAWAAAGVSIPRTTYEQWSALPHIPLSSLQPGDLIYYNGESHVAMYVGVVGGVAYIIDAPRTGLNVERIPENTSWYAQSADGAVQP